MYTECKRRSQDLWNRRKWSQKTCGRNRMKPHTELILGFFQKGPTPLLCSQKGANLQIKLVMVFSKKNHCRPPLHPLKKHCRPTLHPFKKLSPHLRKNRAGVVLRRWPVLFTPPNHNNPGLQKCWEKTEYGEEWEGYLIWLWTNGIRAPSSPEW